MDDITEHSQPAPDKMQPGTGKTVAVGVPVSTGTLRESADGELLDLVRAGASDAYGVLYGRYRDSALRLARRQTRDAQAAEDGVSEAFVSVFSAIKSGSGPVGLFRPYLFTSVVNSVRRANRRAGREDPVEDIESFDSLVPVSNSLVAAFDRASLYSAYRSLPERWQEVIWRLDIEGDPPRKAAPALGISSNAVVALHRRAKAGLRLAYLQRQLAESGIEVCQQPSFDIPAYHLRSLGNHRTAVMADHLQLCRICRAALSQVAHIGVLPSTHRRSLVDVAPESVAAEQLPLDQRHLLRS